MTVYKRLKDFEDAMVNKNGQYEVYGLPQTVKKGDYIYCDMCIFKDAHTYICGRVIKRYAYKTIIEYEYCNL